MRKNRRCICCSVEYAYCPECNGADALKPYWHSEFCGEDCKDLWLTATKFNMGLVSKQEAQEIILELNLKNNSEYVKCVQRDLEVIFDDEKNNESEAIGTDKIHGVVTKKINKAL